MCGKGKTSWAIELINANPNQSFIYVTPLLTEIERIKSNANATFFEPTYNGGRKLNSFNELLSRGCNIATTHSTFSNANDETIELLKQGNYTLILDEVMDVVTEFNSIGSNREHPIREQDVKMLLDKELISIDEFGRVSWIGESYIGGKYTEVERIAKSGNLLLINNTLFLWEFPAEIFDIINNTFVLTYMFDGSFMKYFFQYHHLQYGLVGIEHNTDGYHLAKYRPDHDEREKYKKLINICLDNKLNQYSSAAFSSTWYRNNISTTNEVAKKLKNELYNYFHNDRHAKASEIMWTSIGDKSKNVLKGAGYTSIRSLTSDENKLTPHQKKTVQATLDCYVPCNARASNLYRDRSILAYLCNMWVQPHIRQFFKLKNIEINENAFALSCLIQWIWRSAIRDEKSISLYLPAPRMRKLLQEWLDGKTV
jgi:hypothetical protein